jgi:hypothetical protein
MIGGRNLAVAGWTMAVLAVQAHAQGIYTCVDASGRRLTADRPIPECLGRDQQELNSNGTVRRRLPPSLTPAEQAVADEKARAIEEEQRLAAEARRRDRALKSRYPDEASHQAARRAALGRLDAEAAATEKSLAALSQRRSALQDERRLAGSDTQKASRLQAQLDDLDHQQAALGRAQSAHAAERRRVTDLYDEELARLRQLWSESPARGSAPPAPAASGR